MNGTPTRAHRLDKELGAVGVSGVMRCTMPNSPEAIRCPNCFHIRYSKYGYERLAKAVCVVQPIPCPPRSHVANLQNGRSIFSESMAVKSTPSLRPALTKASLFRIWVTIWAFVELAIAVANDHPMSGTLDHSGLAASTIRSAQVDNILTVYREEMEDNGITCILARQMAKASNSASLMDLMV